MCAVFSAQETLSSGKGYMFDIDTKQTLIYELPCKNKTTIIFRLLSLPQPTHRIFGTHTASATRNRHLETKLARSGTPTWHLHPQHRQFRQCLASLGAQARHASSTNLGSILRDLPIWVEQLPHAKTTKQCKTSGMYLIASKLEALCTSRRVVLCHSFRTWNRRLLPQCQN